LSNNPVSAPLMAWLAEREDVSVHCSPMTPAEVYALRPDIVVSYSYRHVLRREVLDVMPGRFVNLHVSLLPYNRGADPNAWSFLDDTPKGVTIHRIDAGIDTGPILLQREVSFDEVRDTLASSYRTLHEHIRTLFCDSWPAIRDRVIQPSPQIGAGTFHRSADLAPLRERLLGKEGWDVTIGQFRERYQQICLEGAGT
jgi:dTDP-4-amino-4,6-dideoxyglucose formyltransferase